MRAHVEKISKKFNHAGEQGASNERILIGFLTTYLPKRYAVDRGKILASNEEDTNQQDVIIYDPARSSPLFSEDGFLIAGVESVFGVVEVKTTLDKSELEDANKKALSVLLKPRLPTSILNKHPAGFTKISGPTDPPIACCFAFSSATTLETLSNNMLSLQNPALTLVGILDKGIIYGKNGRLVLEEDPANALLRFLITLIDFLSEVPDRQFRLGEYFK